MWGRIVSSFFIEISKASEKRRKHRQKDRYVPKYTGQWVDRNRNKKGSEEDWHWVDKVVTLHKTYVHVFKQGPATYLLAVDKHKTPEFTLEVIECEGEEEVQTTIQLLKAYYSVFGNVIVDNPGDQKGQGEDRT